MGQRGWIITVVALGAVWGPCMARAQAVPAGVAAAAQVPVSPAFDLAATVRPAMPDAREAVRQSLAVKGGELLREKIKIRWQYQPVEGGPSFEVGTLGSRKGAMKSKLLHVAMDWTF